MLPQVLALDRHAVRRRFEQRFSSARMATDYVALYRSLLERPSISERETSVPRSRPVLERKLNGQGLHGDRARRAAETVVHTDFGAALAMISDGEVSERRR